MNLKPLLIPAIAIIIFLAGGFWFLDQFNTLCIPTPGQRNYLMGQAVEAVRILLAGCLLLAAWYMGKGAWGKVKRKV